MTLQIIPPGLSTDETSKPAASDKKFDRQEFFPSSLADGQSSPLARAAKRFDWVWW